MLIKLTPPGSKSIANRALILKALTGNKTTLKNIPDCEDTKYMQAGLKLLSGASPVKIFTGNAGTTTRFLTAVATLFNKRVEISGDKRMSERPIADLIKALNSLGAKTTAKNGCPPVKISPQVPEGGKIQLKGDISSQYISAMLLIAPFLAKPTTIKIVQKLYSKPYVEITLRLLNKFGIRVVNKNFRQFEIHPKKPAPPRSLTIEPDASAASYLGAYAALHPKKEVLIKDLHKNSIQGDIHFIKYLKQIGCKITDTPEGLRTKGPGKIKSLGKLDMNETPDLVMTFAILAMFAEEPTKITNIANLRIKETDRISALKNEITKFGIKIKTTKDSIEIHGSPKTLAEIKKPITIDTYNDHRIAMAFGVIKDLLPLKIKNPECVKKSYPKFWGDLKKLTK